MSRSTLVILLAMLAGLAVLCALGAWQVQRLYWKEGLLATIDARITADPRPLGEADAALRDLREGRTIGRTVLVP